MSDNVIDLMVPRPANDQPIDIKTPTGLLEVTLTIMAQNLLEAGVDGKVFIPQIEKTMEQAMRLFLTTDTVIIKVKE